MNDPAAIARALTEAAAAINSQHSVEETLHAIVEEARRSVPGFDHAGISIIHRDGRVETRAGTDPLVWDLDELQYSLQEGPCLDAIRDESVVVVENARHEQRWPRFIPQAVARGLRAQLGVRLFTDTETLGGLNLYSTETETIATEAVQIAELFANHAARALGTARQEQNLTEAIASRQMIGQAIGIVMERYGLDEDRAFQFLIRASSTSNTKLRRVAEQVVAETNDRGRSRAERN